MDFALFLEQKPGVPLYRTLASAIKNWIEEGRLKPGEFLPSSRELSRLLGVSRVTVVRSYDNLIAQGYLNATTGRGTRVAESLPQLVIDAHQSASSRSLQIIDRSPRLSSYAERLLRSGHVRSGAADMPELNYGAPPSEHLPIQKWREILLRHTRSKDDHASLFESGEPFGYRPLREAIAGYLNRSRGLNCEARQIAVFSNAQIALHLTAQVLLNEGDTVVVENPGFPDARANFIAAGAELVHVDVDEMGMRVEEIDAVTNARLVYISPSHQDPTGCSLNANRRDQLLCWASSRDAFIVEDDYGAEYRYGGKPVPALKGSDRDDRVIYLSSFWKVLFPILPIGYMVVPHCLIPAASRAKELMERTFPIVEQLALTDFINEGYLERHLRRTRQVYERRRQALIFALTTCFGNRISIFKQNSGTSVLVTFNSELSDDQLLSCAVEAEVPMVSTNDYYIEKERKGEFLIGYAAVDGELISEKIERLVELITFAENASC